LPAITASAASAPATVKQDVQLIDLFPTLTELFGLESPADLDGRSLIAALAGSPLPPEVHFAQDGYGQTVSVIQRGRKLHVKYDPNSQTFLPFAYYNLARDPGEQKNLVNSAPAPEITVLLDLAAPYIQRNIQDDASRGVDIMEFETGILETLGYL